MNDNEMCDWMYEISDYIKYKETFTMMEIIDFYHKNHRHIPSRCTVGKYLIRCGYVRQTNGYYVKADTIEKPTVKRYTKEENKQRIYSLINENPGLSRTKIGATLGMSIPQINSHISELVEEKKIIVSAKVKKNNIIPIFYTNDFRGALNEY